MCVKTHLRGNLFCPIDLVEIKKASENAFELVSIEILAV